MPPHELLSGGFAFDGEQELKPVDVRDARAAATIAAPRAADVHLHWRPEYLTGTLLQLDSTLQEDSTASSVP